MSSPEITFPSTIDGFSFLLRSAMEGHINDSGDLKIEAVSLIALPTFTICLSCFPIPCS